VNTGRPEDEASLGVRKMMKFDQQIRIERRRRQALRPFDRDYRGFIVQILFVAKCVKVSDTFESVEIQMIERDILTAAGTTRVFCR
jgi:hypothetical protein